MPTIFKHEDLPTAEKSGINVTTLANQAMLGSDALQVQRIALGAGAESESYKAENTERFIYVIRGMGQAYVGGQVFPLRSESMLWLEKGDAFYFESSADGLEVLLCRAPAGE